MTALILLSTFLFCRCWLSWLDSGGKVGVPDAGFEYFIHSCSWVVSFVLCTALSHSLFGSKWCLQLKSNPKAHGEAEFGGGARSCFLTADQF